MSLGLHRPQRRAFSLVEVVIAIGIVSFAVLAMVGLFPVGFHSGLDSRRETRAAYVAEQVLDDLRGASFTNASILYGSNSDALQHLPVNLQQAGTYFLTCNIDNVPIGTLSSESAYDNSLHDPSVTYLARVQVTPDAVLTNCARVELEVSTPADAPLTNRSRFGVVTLIGPR